MACRRIGAPADQIVAGIVNVKGAFFVD